jgi:hypothetical protein
MKRTTRVRIDLDNSDDRLRPGMFANVDLKINGGEGLTVPVDAVLPSGSRSLVFVDRGSGNTLAGVAAGIYSLTRIPSMRFRTKATSKSSFIQIGKADRRI